MISESPSSEASIQVIAANGCTFASVERPTAGEVDRLTREFGISRADLEEALDRGRVSGVWRRDDYAVVVVVVPILITGSARTGLGASPVTLFVGSSFVVAVHTGEIRPLIRFYRQLETETDARDVAFDRGVASLVRVLIQRLIDSAVAARGRVERSLADTEEIGLLPGDGRSARQSIAAAMRLQAEARQIRRLAAPLPDLIRSLDGVTTLAMRGTDTWESTAGRADRLVGTLDDDLAALDGFLLAASAMATIDGARDARAAATVATLTLPPLTVAALLAMPGGSPLAGQPGGYALSLAGAGIVFLVALFIARRRGMV
jgi:magnesium transporter